MRRLGLSLTVFAIEQEHAPSLEEGFRRVAALDFDRLRALRPAWSAWLDGLAAGESGSPHAQGREH